MNRKEGNLEGPKTLQTLRVQDKTRVFTVSLSLTAGYSRNSACLCLHLLVSVGCRVFSRLRQRKPQTRATSELFTIPLPSALPTYLEKKRLYSSYLPIQPLCIYYISTSIRHLQYLPGNSREKILPPIPSVWSTPGDRNQTLLGGPDRNKARDLLYNPSRRPTTLGRQGPFAFPPSFRLSFHQSIVLPRPSLQS